MSELTYKKITDVELIEALNDNATVFVNDNGAMKQIDVKTAVNLPEKILKTVSSADAEADGTVLSNPTRCFSIIDGSNYGVPLNNYNLYTAQELIESTRQGFIDTVFHRDVMTDDGVVIYYCTKIETLSVNKRKYYFGNELAPIIVDGDSNTFILDPDWVKPKSGSANPVIKFKEINADEDNFSCNISYEDILALDEKDAIDLVIYENSYGRRTYLSYYTNTTSAPVPAVSFHFPYMDDNETPNLHYKSDGVITQYDPNGK